jgi:hypothetical protein
MKLLQKTTKLVAGVGVDIIYTEHKKGDTQSETNHTQKRTRTKIKENQKGTCGKSSYSARYSTTGVPE